MSDRDVSRSKAFDGDLSGPSRVSRRQDSYPFPSMLTAARARIRARLGDVTPTGDDPRRDRAAEDADLVAAIARGEVEALERLYDRYGALVFSVSLRVLHDHHLAEDVVQEVFHRLWRQPTSFDPVRGRFISWMMSVTRNRALDELRRRNRRFRSEERDEDPEREIAGGDWLDDPEVGVVLGEMRTVVRAAMTRLPAAQREVIELGYFGGLTQQEIAERTGDPLGTVKTRVRLGMRRLRVALAEYADVPPTVPEPPDGRDARKTGRAWRQKNERPCSPRTPWAR